MPTAHLKLSSWMWPEQIWPQLWPQISKRLLLSNNLLRSSDIPTLQKALFIFFSFSQTSTQVLSLVLAEDLSLPNKTETFKINPDVLPTLNLPAYLHLYPYPLPSSCHMGELVILLAKANASFNCLDSTPSPLLTDSAPTVIPSPDCNTRFLVSIQLCCNLSHLKNMLLNSTVFPQHLAHFSILIYRKTPRKRWLW